MNMSRQLIANETTFRLSRESEKESNGKNTTEQAKNNVYRVSFFFLTHKTLTNNVHMSLAIDKFNLQTWKKKIMPYILSTICCLDAVLHC